jgi:hypothetical protein
LEWVNENLTIRVVTGGVVFRSELKMVTRETGINVGRGMGSPVADRSRVKVACRRDLIAGRLAHENHDQIQWITSGDGKR